jgi:uncharacterized membrane protein
MTWYTFFKSVHVIAAVVWVGGATMMQVYAIRILSQKDAKRQADFAKDTEFIAMRTFIPSAIVLFLAAIGMMSNANLSWGMNWIVFALVVFFASFVVGAGFIGPESGRLGKVIEEKGVEAPEVGAAIRRILTVSRVELVFLIAVVWNMVVKPIGDAGWFWGGLAVTFLAAAAIIANYLRSEQAASSGNVTATP